MKKRNVKLFGKLQVAKWANIASNGHIEIPAGERKYPMFKSDATGEPLVQEGPFGADIIRFPPGGEVATHTHVGAHILFVIKGRGRVIYDGVTHALEPGVCYFVCPMAPHSIKADDELVLIAVGNDHRHVTSEDRLNTAKPSHKK